MRMFKSGRSGARFLLKSASVLALGAVALPVLAQEAAVEEDAQVQLDTVIVTGEKRPENVQTVPVAISAFATEQLDARGIVSVQDLQATVPGLTISENIQAGTAKITMRGIGSENFSAGGDPGVPLHVNGHYSQFTSYVLRDMIDVERVEVQRGPQGTLYGRNAIGGNINIITKRPTENLEVLLSADIGNYDKRLLQGVLSGPLSEAVRGRLVVSDERRDGYVENLSGGEDLDSSHYTSVRGALEIDLSDNLEAYLNGYWFEDKGAHAVRVTSDYPSSAAYFGGLITGWSMGLVLIRR